ncbi:PTS sugar transporter subunit IIB [Luxibacter massiliensis]|uniref:PTS sugar transporter subunit IIB n=1 Tax=Luxibacter massiliensis TaxID=2219695 RepID=UPI000F0694D7|nr:PTS sugar transporter subunit IIB [Luxibacter massiliensis]
MKIEMLRVDERLLHGQILLKWMEEAGCTKVVFVDDETAENPVMKKILELSFPPGYECSIQGISGFRGLMEAQGEEKSFVVVKKISTLYEMFKQGYVPGIINLGNTSYGIGKLKLAQGVYTTLREKEQLMEISLRAALFYQPVPDSRKVNINQLLGHI